MSSCVRCRELYIRWWSCCSSNNSRYPTCTRRCQDSEVLPLTSVSCRHRLIQCLHLSPTARLPFCRNSISSTVSFTVSFNKSNTQSDGALSSVNNQHIMLAKKVVWGRWWHRWIEHCWVSVDCLSRWRFGLVGNPVGRISQVNQHWACLVLGWVTVGRQVYHLRAPSCPEIPEI